MKNATNKNANILNDIFKEIRLLRNEISFLVPTENLKEYLNDNDEEDPSLPDPLIPCHIQGTERHVQLLVGVAKRAIHKNREGIMAVTLESRQKLTRMETKKDFQGNL